MTTPTTTPAGEGGLSDELRRQCEVLRMRPIPLNHMIPLMQRAADALDATLATQVTLTMDQAKVVFDALDIGLGAASQEAAVYHEAMAGHREGEHKRLDADAAKVSAALVMVGQLIEEHEQAKETK